MIDMVENLKTEGTNGPVFEQVNEESPHKSTESRCLEHRVHSYWTFKPEASSSLIWFRVSLNYLSVSQESTNT